MSGYTPAKKGTPVEEKTDYKPARKTEPTPSEKVRGWNCGFSDMAMERARKRALEDLD